MDYESHYRWYDVPLQQHTGQSVDRIYGKITHLVITGQPDTKNTTSPPYSELSVSWLPQTWVKGRTQNTKYSISIKSDIKKGVKTVGTNVCCISLADQSPP